MRIGIVGTGLIGSSIGLAARAAGHTTSGWDADPLAAVESQRVGAVETVALTLAHLLAKAEVVVIATPLEATVELLRAFPPAPRATLIVDVASVKVPVLAAAAGVPSFVAGHPLAGRELTGPAAADGDLFRDRTWAYVAPPDRSLEERARAFIADLGARPLPVDAERHDAVVAFTSHLPQLVATALGSMLADRLDDPLVRDLCGTGMRSMTRLGTSAWTVWGSVLEANAGAVAQEVRALIGILRSVAQALESGNETDLAARFARAAAAAAALDTNEPQPPVV